ncbi:MAG: N-formylglutamate amidohydrolase [Pseudomonadota bacterium]
MTQAKSHSLIGETRGSRYVILVDHASNRVPDEIANGDLGLPPTDMARHIAYDIGAAAVGQYLGEILDAPVLLSEFSRLVIDPNRAEDDPTLIMQLYDGSIIPGNRSIRDADRAYRIETYHRPYRQAAEALAASKEDPILVAIHSFTPQLKGRPARPWEVGILFAHDRRYSDHLIDVLQGMLNSPVGVNQPYNGALEGDTMDQIALQKSRHHALIELRNDLIETDAGAKKWATTMAEAVKAATARLEG